MSSPQILALFLKALIAARKSVGLYPAGSEIAKAWVQRLHRSLDAFFVQGLSFPIKVGRDRFEWAGEDVLAVDPALEAFRFDLEVRGIAEFAIDAEVEDWELRAFLELLNQAPGSLLSVIGAPAFLRERNVVRVRVGTPSASAGPAEGARSNPNWRLLETGKDELDLLVDAVLELTEERFADLAYDRTGLTGWLKTVADGDQVDVLYSALKMLGGMAEGAGDREIRTRTLIEAILMLPEPTLEPLLTKWLIPLAGTDLIAFNLLTQLTEDELGEVGRIVPEEQLLALSTELLEFPWEEGKRQRFLEAITLTVRRREGPELPVGLAAPLAPDDPVLVDLRQELTASCHPDVLLERSADILLALVFDPGNEEYPGFAVDALEEILGEALARGRLDLAVRVLSSLGVSTERVSTELGGDRMREHARRVTIFRRRVAGRTQIQLVAGLMRKSAGTEQMAEAAAYLRLVAREAIEEFMTLLAEERDRRVRARMCQVLASVGPAIIPGLLPWLDDSRWYVVRNILYILGRIGHESVFMSAAGLLDHGHPRVRGEAIRALRLIGGARAVGPISRCLADADSFVCVAAVKALGSLRSDEAVPALEELLASAPAAAEDLEVKREAIRALSAIGSRAARSALTALAGRRVWFWRRSERQIRAMADAALSGNGPAAAALREGDDGG